MVDRMLSKDTYEFFFWGRGKGLYRPMEDWNGSFMSHEWSVGSAAIVPDAFVK